MEVYTVSPLKSIVGGDVKHGPKQSLFIPTYCTSQVGRSQHCLSSFRTVLQRSSMDDLLEEQAWKTKLEHWLRFDTRCFGDKGDVEDITEGQ